MKRKAFLFIHGIGPQPKKYSDRLWKMLWQDDEPAGIHKYELFYYDIFEKMNEKIEMKKFTKKYGFTKILETFIQDKKTVDNIDRQATVILNDTVSHVLYFLLCRDVRNAVINRFKRKLLTIIRTAMQAGVPKSQLEITIVAHSLGTIVGYVGLHTIVNEKHLAVKRGVKIENFFTLACPLALIKELSSKLSVVQIPSITDGIKKPVYVTPRSKRRMTNINHWYSYRHALDPVASLVPLRGGFLDSKDDATYVFSKIHSGNMHAFENYIEQARGMVLRRA